MSKAAIVLALCSSWIVACAMGGTSSHQGNADAQKGIDAPGAPHDAHAAGDGPVTPHDAHPLDAFVPQDAPHHFGSAGDVCLVNTDCDANLGLCCYLFACKSGTGVGSNLCFPN
ncbi:MAG TPA: hypothetical protein VFQ65_11930 [Kofleriaceae bacterium]|nr:hypothetical protein [Kofleriaceae bacterium]